MTLLEAGYPRTKVSGQAMWFGLWVGVTAIAAFLHPDRAGHGTHQQLGFPPCPSVLIFDRPCPGCGLTTSWTALVHGDFGFAFHAHPLGPLLYGLFTFSAIAGLIGFFSGRRLVLDSIPMSRFLGTFAVVFLGFGLIRMATTPHFSTERERFLPIVSRFAGQ